MVNDPTPPARDPNQATASKPNPGPSPGSAKSGDQAAASEEFGALPSPSTPVEPSVDETVAFINAKLKAAAKYRGQAFQVGYVTSIGKWVLRTFKGGQIAEAVTFSVSDMNPGKIITVTKSGRSEESSVIIHCTEDVEKAEMLLFYFKPPQRGKTSVVAFPCRDRFDMEKMAKALSNLIHAYGGKAEAF